jgi:hypothetical protein
MNLNVPEEEVWYPDTGASNHMTSTSGNLNSIRSYLGNEKKLVGNGVIISITKTENTSLNIDTHSFDLKMSL